MSYFRLLAAIMALSLMASCQPPTKYTTHEEYVEKYEWHREKGLVKSPHASWSIDWES